MPNSSKTWLDYSLQTFTQESLTMARMSHLQQLPSENYLFQCFSSIENKTIRKRQWGKSLTYLLSKKIIVIIDRWSMKVFTRTPWRLFCLVFVGTAWKKRNTRKLNKKIQLQVQLMLSSHTKWIDIEIFYRKLFTRHFVDIYLMPRSKK